MSNLDELQERVWQNAWNVEVASLRTLDAPCLGVRAWFEGPRHGWLYFHLDLIGSGEFFCRASHVPNDFVTELVQALCDILKRAQETQAAAHGEPDTFELRFARQPRSKDVRFDLVHFPSFDNRKQADAEKVLSIEGQGDSICRAFCAGLRDLQEQISANEYLAEMQFPFPARAVAELSKLLGGAAKPGTPPKVTIAAKPAAKPTAKPPAKPTVKPSKPKKPKPAAKPKKPKSAAKPPKKPKRKGK